MKAMFVTRYARNGLRDVVDKHASTQIIIDGLIEMFAGSAFFVGYTLYLDLCEKNSS